MHRCVLTLDFLGSDKENRGFAAQFGVTKWDLTSKFLSAGTEDVSDGASEGADEVGGSRIHVYDLKRKCLDLFEVEIELYKGQGKDTRG